MYPTIFTAEFDKYLVIYGGMLGSQDIYIYIYQSYVVDTNKKDMKSIMLTDDNEKVKVIMIGYYR